MDKKSERLEIRISERDLLLFQYVASCANMTPSEYLRMMIDGAIRPTKDKILKQELTYENVKTILDDKLQFRKLFKK